MATEKVTPMVLKVDLQCPSCYKKIRKVLCKIPQIRDQVFDEKNNAVHIVVVCCSPEKIRDKLCYKGGKVIKSIEIKDADKPKKPEKEKESSDKPKDAEKPNQKPKDPEKSKVKIIEPPAEKPKPNGKAPLAAGKMLEPIPASGVPSVFPYIGPAYDPYGSGPYYHGYGFPPPPPPPPPPPLPCYEGYYGYGSGYAYGSAPGYGYNRVGPVNRSDCYFSEENPQSCSIM